MTAPIAEPVLGQRVRLSIVSGATTRLFHQPSIAAQEDKSNETPKVGKVLNDSCRHSSGRVQLKAYILPQPEYVQSKTRHDRQLSAFGAPEGQIAHTFLTLQN